MSRGIFQLLVVVLLALPARVQAQCTKQTYTDPLIQPDFDCPSPGEEELLPKLELRPSIGLEPTQPAPWAGILMDRDRVFLLGMRIQALRRIRWNETLGCAERLEAEIDYISQTKQATLTLCIKQRDNYKKQVEAAQKEVIKAHKWYRSPALWFTAGFVIAAAGTTIIVVAVQD
jgi:hypothetical protein